MKSVLITALWAVATSLILRRRVPPAGLARAGCLVLLCGACDRRVQPRDSATAATTVVATRATAAPVHPLPAMLPAAPPQPLATGSVEPPSLPSAAAAGATPAAAVSRYLALNVFHGAPAGEDSLGACPPDTAEGAGEWEADAYIGYVLPRVLDVSSDAADSNAAVVRAVVVRVASTYRDHPSWAAELDAVTDTLSFSMQRVPAGWTVCAPPVRMHGTKAEDSPIFFMTADNPYEARDAHWREPGMTWAGAAAHADSIAAGAPLVRREPPRPRSPGATSP